MEDFETKKDKFLLRLIILSLILLNIFFYTTKFYPETSPAIFTWVYEIYQANKVGFTVLEIIGVSVIFIDMIIRFDKFDIIKKTLYVSLVSLLVMASFLRATFSYMDATYKPPGDTSCLIEEIYFV